MQTTTRTPDRLSLGVLALACVWWVVALGVFGAGVPAPLDDAWEYSLVARHLVAGDGFRTTMIHPPLWPLHDAALSVPVLVHGPLLPLLLVPVQLAGLETVGAIAWMAAAFATLAAFVLYRSAARIMGPCDAAAAALLFTLSPLALRTVTHDASFAIGSFWLILAVERLTVGRPFAAGLAAGVGALVRPEFLFIAVVLTAVARGARARLLGACALVYAPWAWHQTVSSGAPLFNLSSYLLLSFTPAYPDLSALRSFDLTIDRWPHALATALPSLVTKWAYALPRAFKHLVTAPTVATGWLAGVGMFVAWRRGSARGKSAVSASAGRSTTMRASVNVLPGPAAALVAIPLALMIAAQHRPDFVMPFLPLWALTAAVGTRGLAERAGLRAAPVVLAIAVLLAAPSAVLALRSASREARANEAWLARERAALAARVGADRAAGPVLMFSDTPDFVAWTSGRPSIWVTRDEFERLYADAAIGRAPLPHDLPARRDAAATWFHEDPRALQ